MSLGNVKDRRFREIWNDQQNEFLIGMRRKRELVTGRCGRCSYKAVCAGCRIRAEVVNGDIWAEDPACYLSDAEVGADEEGP